MSRLEEIRHWYGGCSPQAHGKTAPVVPGCVRCTIAYLLTLVQGGEQLAACADIAQRFGVEWAEAHRQDDHLVTLDHQDEQLLAELVSQLCQAKAVYDTLQMTGETANP